MIRSFHDADTEAIFRQQLVRRFQAISTVGLRRLVQIDSAEELRDLAMNRLEALKGDRRGQYSVLINDQYRVCFRWKDGDAFEVEIADYH